MIKSRYYNSNFITYLFFFIFLLIGIFTFKDYGIGIDDKFHRLNGFYWLNYLLSFTDFESLKSVANLKLLEISDLSLPSIIKYNNYSIIFDVPTAFAEIIFKIENPKEYYQFRHFLNFIFFYVGSIFFFKILKLRFNKFVAFFGACLFIISPRLYGDSFYNMKDIIYLTFLTISYYYCLKCFNSLSIKNLFILAILSAASIQIRILGLAIPASLISFYFLDCLSKTYNLKKFYKIFFYFTSTIIITYLLWPYLWLSPIKNFIGSFHNIIPEIYVLFNGNYVKNSFLPYSYVPVWILISTPIIHLILFFSGFIYLLKRLFNRIVNINEQNISYDFWNGKNEKFDVFIFLNFLILTILIIFLNVRLFNTWKHLYFLNFYIIYFASFSLHLLYILFRKNIIRFNVMHLIILINIFFVIFRMHNYHPYQGLYFNFLITDKIKSNFEIDFTALSAKHFFDNIFKLEKDSEKIFIAAASWTPLIRTLDIYSKSKKDKIILLGQNYQKADYIYSNNISEVDKKSDDKYDIPNNFIKLYDFEVDGAILYTVYKKNNL